MNFINNFIVKLLPYLPKRFIQIFAKRYVAGTSINEALTIIKVFNEQGQKATIDILGEHEYNINIINKTIQEYKEILDKIMKMNLDCNISIKPSHIGADINYETLLKNFSILKNTANKNNNFIRFDMENSKLTDTTIKLYNNLNNNNLGLVIQSYLFRSEADILKLDDGVNIRLCKGIYKESETIAYQSYKTINNNYIRLLKLAFKKNLFIGIATHDKNLIRECIHIIEEMNISNDRFEFQYLYGVPMDDMIDIYKNKGYDIRVYVPFGMKWYGYSIRRIKENPKIASYVIKNIFK